MRCQACCVDTPMTSTFHHSGTPPASVVTMWLCGGNSALPVPDPKMRLRSIRFGWSTQFPAWGHCSVYGFFGVKPSGTTTYSGSNSLDGMASYSAPSSQLDVAALLGGSLQKKFCR